MGLLEEEWWPPRLLAFRIIKISEINQKVTSTITQGIHRKKKPSTVAQTFPSQREIYFVRVISLVIHLLLIAELQHALSFNVHFVYNVFSTFKLIWMSMNFHASLWNRFFRQLFTHHYGGVWETSSRKWIRRIAFTRKNVEENHPRLDETRFKQRSEMKTMFKEKRRQEQHKIYGSAGWYFWFLLVLYVWRSA